MRARQPLARRSKRVGASARTLIHATREAREEAGPGAWLPAGAVSLAKERLVSSLRHVSVYQLKTAVGGVRGLLSLPREDVDKCTAAHEFFRSQLADQRAKAGMILSFVGTETTVRPAIHNKRVWLSRQRSTRQVQCTASWLRVPSKAGLLFKRKIVWASREVARAHQLQLRGRFASDPLFELVLLD